MGTIVDDLSALMTAWTKAGAAQDTESLSRRMATVLPKEGPKKTGRSSTTSSGPSSNATLSAEELKALCLRLDLKLGIARCCKLSAPAQ
jgi:hypothetical protein